jgi:hypothetical protein
LAVLFYGRPITYDRTQNAQNGGLESTHPSSGLSRKEQLAYQMIKAKALHYMPILMDRLKFT